MIWIPVTGAFLGTFGVVIAVSMIWYLATYKQGDPVIVTDARAIEILEHAIERLEPLGLGKDFEYARARYILQQSLDEVKRELFAKNTRARSIQFAKKTEVVNV